MPYHVAFGLYMQCNCPVPGLVARAGVEKVNLEVWLTPPTEPIARLPDFSWSVSRVSQTKVEQDRPLWTIETNQDSSYLRLTYADRTQFIVNRHGTEVWGTWPQELTLEDTATYLLGPVMGLVLLLRGVTCLHASAIAIGDRAIAIVGRSGAGKSTTAAAFAELGYPIISDDIVALVDRDRNILVQPAYPRLRLWPSSAEILYKRSDALPRIVPTHPTWDKAYLDLNQERYQFQDKPLPLAGIYVLGKRTNDSPMPSLELLSQHQALMKLVGNTYANLLLDKTMRMQEFKFLSETVQHIPVYQLHAHPDGSYLFNLPTVILENLADV